MSINNEKIAALLIKHLEGELDVQEQSELKAWLQESAVHEQVAKEFMEAETLRANVVAALSKDIAWKWVEEAIQKKQEAKIIPTRKWLSWATVAATIIVMLGVGVYLSGQKNHSQQLANEHGPALAATKENHIGAILTLSDGSRVALDSLSNGVVAQQTGSEAVLQNGQLAYNATGSATGEIVYNTMSTPKGRQFALQLPDGTNVWLNAASSIRFPTVFTGNERKVEVQGEVYFEVVSNSKMPFRVNIANKAEVEVLGTNFNVNAYENENNIYTTLLEGSVKMLTGQKGTGRAEAILQPGHQALLNQGRNIEPAIEILKNVDIDQVMAWKVGLFDFYNFGLKEVMRQLERWYDIEVTYESTVPDVKLKGKMTRDVSLTGLIRNLGKLGVHCRLEGRNLVVLP